MFSAFYLLAVFLGFFYLLWTSLRECVRIAKSDVPQREMHSTGEQRQRRQYQASLISIGITLSTITKTRDLEAEIKKPKDQVSSRKRHYGPEKRKYQNNYTGLSDLMAANLEKAIVCRSSYPPKHQKSFVLASGTCMPRGGSQQSN
jgi:hypothetical protein